MKFQDFYIGFFHVFREHIENEKDTSELEEHFELESSNPPDTVQVAVYNRKNLLAPHQVFSKEFFYVCKVRNLGSKSYLLFSIWRDTDWNLWRRYSWYACSEASSHSEAADWMLKKIIDENSLDLTEGSLQIKV